MERVTGLSDKLLITFYRTGELPDIMLSAIQAELQDRGYQLTWTLHGVPDFIRTVH